jgi:hypothetical protein
MAQPINCDLCEERPALFMVTRTDNGDTTAACPWCFPALSEVVVKAIEAALNESQEPTSPPTVTVGAPGDGWEYESPPTRPKSHHRADKGPNGVTPEAAEEAEATHDGR